MMKALAKSKLTLWVPEGAKKFSKEWAKMHRESVSQLFTDFILRLRKTESIPGEASPIVSRLTGVIASRKAAKEDYQRHLEKKYLHG